MAVGYHRNQLKGFAEILGKAGDEMRIHGEGENDHLGPVGPKQIFDPSLGCPMNKKAVFDQRQAVAGRVK
jgi:hypothetical protein